MDADYDTFAAYAIIAIAVTAKLWPALKKQLDQTQTLSTQGVTNDQALKQSRA
jgi:hypothetical protein